MVIGGISHVTGHEFRRDVYGELPVTMKPAACLTRVRWSPNVRPARARTAWAACSTSPAEPGSSASPYTRSSRTWAVDQESRHDAGRLREGL